MTKNKYYCTECNEECSLALYKDGGDGKLALICTECSLNKLLKTKEMGTTKEWITRKWSNINWLLLRRIICSPLAFTILLGGSFALTFALTFAFLLMAAFILALGVFWLILWLLGVEDEDIGACVDNSFELASPFQLTKSSVINYYLSMWVVVWYPFYGTYMYIKENKFI